MLKGKDAVSISNIEKKSTSGLTDTYEITLTNGSKKTFTVSNGKGIKSIAKTSTSGLTDTYTTTYNDGTSSTFTVKNGDKGDTGSIDNLKIGGVNLLSDTKDFSGNWENKDRWNISEEKYNGLTVLTNKRIWSGLQKSVEGKKGEKYTFSLYLKRLKQDVDIEFFAYIKDGAETDKENHIINVTSEWKRYYITFTLTKDGRFSPRVECNADVEGVFSMCGLKLEREETPTDWTPSIEDIENEIASAKDILNKTYPVGSIYMSVNSTEPSTLFGGTWERLQGRFLIGAGTNTEINSNGDYGDIGHGDPNFAGGETGGEYYHQLNTTEMPEHHHDTNDWTMVANKDAVKISTNFGAKCISAPETTNIVPNIKATKNEDGNATGDAGGDGKHNNMPPYLAVYMWKRTA